MNYRTHRLIPLCLFLLFLLPPGAAAGQQPSSLDFTELEKVIAAELKDIGAPGAAIAIISGDRLIYAKGFGVANVETGAPVSPDMLFRLGSTAKMFTAAALVMLAEEGKLKLDEPIGKYAKGLSPRISQLTAEQLLSHRAGLKDDAVMNGLHDDSALAETVRRVKDDFLFAEPERIFSYSNTGYWLAGYVIEQVSGSHYADLLSARLFQPLGMRRTTLRPTLAMTWPLSQGHEVAAGGMPQVIRPFADNAGNWPAGSIFSSVNDLARFTIAFMNGGRLDGQQVLPPAVIAQLSEPRADIPGTDQRYGYGLFVGAHRGVRILEHGGSRSGFGSLIRMAPEQRVAVIILVNKTGGALNKSAEKAMEMLLPLGAKGEAEAAPMPMTETEMAKYVGVYGYEPNTIGISMKDGQLFLKRAGQELPIRKLGERRFAVVLAGAAEPQKFALVPGADGKAEYLHLGGRALKRVESH